MNEDNVVQMPDKVTRLVRRIKDALAKLDHSREEWIEGVIELCAAAVEARTEYGSNQAFGKWWNTQGFCRADGSSLNEKDREACITMGGDLGRLRQVLAKTERSSLQLICREEFRLDSVSETTSKRRQSKRPVLNRAREIVRPLVDKNAPINRTALERQHGISERTFRAALEGEEARAEALKTIDEDVLAEAARAALPKTSQEKIDIVLRRERKRLEQEFDERARLEANRLLETVSLPFYNEKLKLYEAVVAGRSGVFTKAEFDKIIKCLHSDHVTPLGPKTVRQHDEAFILFRNAEIKLVDEDGSPQMGDRPWTMADLDRRREEAKADRAAQRAAKAKSGKK